MNPLLPDAVINKLPLFVQPVDAVGVAVTIIVLPAQELVGLLGFDGASGELLLHELRHNKNEIIVGAISLLAVRYLITNLSC